MMLKTERQKESDLLDIIHLLNVDDSEKRSAKYILNIARRYGFSVIVDGVELDNYDFLGLFFDDDLLYLNEAVDANDQGAVLKELYKLSDDVGGIVRI